MRGVVSAGMVTALEELGRTDAFDAVYGSSAGAINAAYFLAGQAAVGTTIYYEDINNRQFIDRRQMWRGRPIVNLSYLIDDVAVRRKPLDGERVLASRAPLTVVVTDVSTAEPVALGPFATVGSLRAALRATATMPVVAGGPAVNDGREYFDASITEPIPLRVAEAAGHTHILALLTRPGNVRRRSTVLDRLYVLPKLKRISPALATRYRNRRGPYTATLANIAAGRGPAGSAIVCGIRPAPPVVRLLECDAAALKRGAAAGHEAVIEAFNES